MIILRSRGKLNLFIRLDSCIWIHDDDDLSQIQGLGLTNTDPKRWIQLVYCTKDLQGLVRVENLEDLRSRFESNLLRAQESPFKTF